MSRGEPATAPTTFRPAERRRGKRRGKRERQRCDGGQWRATVVRCFLSAVKVSEENEIEAKKPEGREAVDLMGGVQSILLRDE